MKVFVSSTFLDFQAEREMMNASVFPDFRKAAQKFGITPELIDLRWGVDNWSNNTDSITKTLDACLGAIKNSSAMIIFLGDRQGFIPDNIPDIIRTKFGLARKTDDTRNTKLSITGLEIEYAMMLREKFDGKVIICIRSITSIPPEVRARYIEEDAKNGLDKLKDRLRKNYGTSVIDYTAEWTGQELGNFMAGGNPLADVLIARMKAMYQTEWMLDSGLSWQERAIKLSRRSIDDSTASFSSRKKLINDLEDKLRSHMYLFMKASEGFGKTAITSKLAQRLGAFCFFANSGFTDKPDNAQHMLELMVYCLEEKLNCEHLVIQENFNLSPLHESRYVRFKLRFEELCTMLPDDEPTFFIIDGLDKLDADEHRDSADILPMTGNVHCLVSCSEDFEIPITYRNCDEACMRGIEALSPEETLEILSKILGRNEKELYAEAKQAVLSHTEPNPLKLSMMAKLLDASITAQELQALKDNSRGITKLVTKIISDFNDDPAEAACDILSKAATKLFGNGAQRILGMTEFIAVSRNGLRLSDLAVLDENFSESDFFMFIRYMDIFFMERQDGRIDFRHDCARRGVLSGVTQEKIDEIDKKIGRHVLRLPPDDTLRNSEGFFYAERFKNYAEAGKLIDEVFESRDPCLQYEIDKHLMANEGKFCIELLHCHWKFMKPETKEKVHTYLSLKAEVLSLENDTATVQKIFTQLSDILNTDDPSYYQNELMLARNETTMQRFNEARRRYLKIIKVGKYHPQWRKERSFCSIMCSAYTLLAENILNSMIRKGTPTTNEAVETLRYSVEAISWADSLLKLDDGELGMSLKAYAHLTAVNCASAIIKRECLPEVIAEIIAEAHVVYELFGTLVKKFPTVFNIQNMVLSCLQMARMYAKNDDLNRQSFYAEEGRKYTEKMLSVSRGNADSVLIAARIFAESALTAEIVGHHEEAVIHAQESLKYSLQIRELDPLGGNADMIASAMLSIIRGDDILS